MNTYAILFFGAIFIVLAFIGLRYPNVKRDWKMDVRSTVRLLVTILSTVLLFFLLWFFLSQVDLPDIMTTATYTIFIFIGVLFIAALFLRK
ncbi:MAG: hypothetical protein KAI64_05485 [Thermoplasmata archaeon]|nr:hypothetical protein [Thermoplasmata archaeon]